MVPFTWHEEELILHPSRCIFWEKERALILSDLHIGKTGHFRKEGIAVPQSVYQQDLHRLFDTIQYFNPAQVILVGDLFHSRSNKEWDWFGKWRNDFAGIDFTLVLGNHDKVPTQVANELKLQVTTQLQTGPFLFLHDASDVEDIPDGALGIISGHVHPAVNIQTGIRQSLCLPCFHFTPTTCTLPAFSLFTGRHVIRPKAADAVFVVTGNEVIEM
jgi:DNA ligase-associated metallophosphoesterase